MAMWLLSIVAVIAAFGSLACAFLVIFLPKSQTAGIVTLKIDLARLVLGQKYGQRSESWVRGDFNPLPDAVQTAVAAATSVAGDRASNLASAVQSGIDAAATAAATTVGSIMKGIDPDTVPQQVSIGINQWCIKYPEHIECHQPPVRFSDILPHPLSNLLQDHQDQLQHLSNVLQNAIDGTVRYPMIIASILVSTIIIYWLWSRISAWKIPKRCHIIFLALLSLGCLICGVLPTTSIFVFQGRLHDTVTKDFAPFSVEDGVDGLISLGFLSWVILMVISIFVALLL